MVASSASVVTVSRSHSGGLLSAGSNYNCAVNWCQLAPAAAVAAVSSADGQSVVLPCRWQRERGRKGETFSLQQPAITNV